MTEESPVVAFLTPRLQRWLTALAILATVAAAFIVFYDVLGLISYFSDVIMIFFLAWLLMFILSPLANGLLHLFPSLPRSLAVIVVYSVLVILILAALLLVTQQLYSSLSTLLNNFPGTDQQKTILQPWQDRLNSLGLERINLAEQTTLALDNLKNGANQLVGPLSDVAVASIGVMGNVLFVFFLSLFMAVDRDRIMSFLFRLVPPAYTEEARLLEHSVSRSFGGFLRGQATLGLIYGLISMLASLLLGIPYMPVTAVASGVLQAIPFFGPFISWVPPVAVAIFFTPDAVLPAFVIMVVGWFVLMNIVQPRLMSNAVGLHPVVVLGSVVIGGKVAGIPGAIFAVPIAAVAASFFFFYLGRNRDTGSVALRAARRVEEREGRPVRVPRLPQAGEDLEVEPPEVKAATSRTASLRRRFRPSGPPLAQARQVGPKADNPAASASSGGRNGGKPDAGADEIAADSAADSPATGTAGTAGDAKAAGDAGDDPSSI
jgi:predicted PurR-regulated permease PerM